jgi:hypothetical protein
MTIHISSSNFFRHYVCGYTHLVYPSVVLVSLITCMLYGLYYSRIILSMSQLNYFLCLKIPINLFVYILFEIIDVHPYV